MKLGRREVILSGAAVGLAACAPKLPEGARVIVPGDYDHAEPVEFSADAVAESALLFPLGLQAGAMRQDGAVLWTRLEGATTARLRLWRETDTDGTVALVLDRTVTTDANGYVRARVDTLAPATWYRYAFFDAALAQRSPLGRFRTAYPDDWAEPMLLGATSCTNHRMQPWVALSATAQQPIDAFIHLGDVSYNDSANTADEFRALWKRTLSDPGYRDLLPSVGWYVTYDDHELANDLDPETTDPLRLQRARESFFETTPVELGSEGQTWRSYSWGGTAEFFVLDCRSERKPSTIGTPDATYLSRAQMNWLKGALAKSTAHFKVVMNSVPITAFPPPLWAVVNDRWQGYGPAREELLNHIIDQDIRNVLFLTGDFHLGLVMRVEKEGPRRRLWEIACGPGGNSGNPLSLVWESPPNRETGFPKGQFEYCCGVPSVTTVALNPKDDSVTVKFLDPANGDVRFEQVLRETEPA